MRKRLALTTTTAVAALAVAAGSASAHSINLTKAQKAAEKEALVTLIDMGSLYGGPDTWGAGACKGKKKQGHRHVAYCNYLVEGKSDDIGEWQCYGKMRVVFKKKSRALKASTHTMTHWQEK